MPERSLLTTLAGAVSPLITDRSTPEAIDENSVWLNRDWGKCTDYLKEDLVMDPPSSVMNQESAWEIPKLAHLISGICLELTLPPATVVPVGAPVSYNDFTAYALLDYFNIIFAANLNYNRQDNDLIFHYYKALNGFVRGAVDQLVGGNLTLAQRSLDVVNGRTYFLDMFLPFESSPSMALPLTTLSQKLRFVFKSKPLANFLFNPTGATVTQVGVPQFRLRMKVVHLTGDEGDMFMDLSNDKFGLSYLIHQNIRQVAQFSATGAQEIAIPLTGIVKPIKNLYFALIPEKLRNNTGRNDQFFFTANPTVGPVPPGLTPWGGIIDWRVESNGLQIQRPLPNVYNRIGDHYKYNPQSPYGQEIYELEFSEMPHAPNTNKGYMDFSNLNNPILYLRTGPGGTGADPDVPANPQVITTIVNAKDFNFWYIKNGNFTKAFQ